MTLKAVTSDINKAIEDPDQPRTPKPIETGLPEGCPVTPLGFSDDVYFYLDERRQLRALKAREHTRLNILSLFGKRTDFLIKHFGKTDKKGKKTGGFHTEQIEALLLSSCARMGLVNAFEKVRGSGGWRNGAGDLLFHCGDQLIVAGEVLDPGEHDGFVYPAGPPTPKPAPRLPDATPGQELLKIFQTWAWKRPDVDPYLLLGWVGAAFLGGALDWRPLAWVTGDKATGKSTLHEILRHVQGGAIVSVSDATSAGIWQKLGHKTLPVAIDELEAEENNTRTQNIIRLARQASSGGVVLRGGAEHSGMEFTARSCFLFSSILLPGLLSQDKSRMAILELEKLPDKAVAPKIEPNMLNGLGQGLRRLLMDRWERFECTLLTYQATLMEVGYDGRAADQLGTLLACHDLLLYDDDPTTKLLEVWQGRLDPALMADPDENLANHEQCLLHILTSLIDPYGSRSRRTVADYVRELAGELATAPKMDKALNSYGLKLRLIATERGPKKGRGWVLYVANSHQGLTAMFKDTLWGARSGASGVWVQALGRIEGTIADSQRFNGVVMRCRRVPINHIIDKAAPDQGASAFPNI